MLRHLVEHPLQWLASRHCDGDAARLALGDALAWPEPNNLAVVVRPLQAQKVALALAGPNAHQQGQMQMGRGGLEKGGLVVERPNLVDPLGW